MDYAYAIALAALCLCLFAAVIPVVPAVPAMFVITLLYGVLTGFSTLGWLEITGLFLIAGSAVAVDQLAGLLGATYGGAHKASLLYGFIGMLAGTLLLPPFGGFLGLFIGIVAGELGRHGNASRAVRAGTGSVIGAAAGQVVIVILALVYVITFALLARA